MKWSIRHCGVILYQKIIRYPDLRADSNKQRQKLETFYRINGAIYMADVKAFLENTNLYREDCYAYKMPAERSIDIDTELDFKIAETIINQ